MQKKGFQKISREEIPLNQSGETEVDLYLHLPTENRYVRYFVAGDFLDPMRLERISTHLVPDFFVDELTLSKIKAANQGEGSTLVYNQKKPRLQIGELPIEAVEVLSRDAEKRIHNITQALLAIPMQDPARTLNELESVTDEIIALVAPEAKIIKKYLLQFTQHIDLMNNASAITTLAVMIATANGFDSTKSYKELSFAALIMDVGMAELLEEDQAQYFKNASILNPKAKEIVRNHPAKSHQLATEKLPSLSEVTLQLILTHHELYNGKGFPRGIRTESLAPIMKVLPLAVDVFEFLKRHELESKPTTLLEAFKYFANEEVEPHLRRHAKKLTDACVAYLTLENPSEEKKRSA